MQCLGSSTDSYSFRNAKTGKIGRDYIWVILGLYRGYIGIMEKKMEITV